MADVTRNSFDPTAHRAEVIFQRGVDVQDCELNELQQISTHDRYMASLVSGCDGVGDYGFCAVGSGLSQDLTINAGTYTVQGLSYTLAANTLLSTLMGSANPLPTRGSNQHDYVFVDFQLIEVDAATDPTMAVAALGETTRRKVLRATWGVGDAALGTPAGAGDLYSNGVVRAIIATVWRPAATAAVAAVNVLRSAKLSRAFTASLDAGMSFGLHPSSSVAWDESITTLRIRNPMSLLDADAGLLITWASGTAYSVYGNYVIPAGSALYLKPKRLASQEWGGGFVRTALSIQPSTSDPEGSLVVLPFLTAEASDHIMIAVNLGDTVQLGHGRTIKVAEQWDSEWTYGSWAGEGQRSKETFRLTVGTASDPRGDINGANAVLTALNLIPHLAGGYEHIEICLLPGTHTISTTAATNRFYYDATADAAAMRLTIRGAGVTNTLLQVSNASVTSAFLRFNGGANPLTVELIDFAIEDTNAHVSRLAIDIAARHVMMRGFGTVNTQISAIVVNAGSMRVRDCEFSPATGNTVAAVALSGDAAAFAKLWIDDSKFWSATSGSGNVLTTDGFSEIRIRGNEWYSLTTTDSVRMLDVVSSATYGVSEYVLIDGNTFTKRSGGGGCPIRARQGKRISIRNNAIYAPTAAVGWYGVSPYIDVTWDRAGGTVASYTALDCRIEGNTIEIGYDDGAATTAIGVALGATNGISTCREVHVDGNSIVGNSFVNTDPTVIAIDIGASSGGGNKLIDACTVSGNTIVMAGVAHTGSFIGVRLGDNTTYSAGTNDFGNVVVSGNIIKSEGSAGHATLVRTAWGVYVQAPARSARIEGNTIKLRVATFGAGPCTSDGVFVRLGADYIGISGNTLQAQYPVELLGTYAYVEGNHTVLSANPAASRTAVAGTNTFNVATSYAAIANVSDNKEA